MNTILLITLAILIPILAIIFIMGCFLIYKKSEKGTLLKKVSDLKYELNLDKETYFNAMINRVDLVTKINPKFKDLNSKISDVYNELIDEITIAKKTIAKIFFALKSNRFRSSIIKKKIVKCSNRKNKIADLTTKFKALSSTIIQQDDFVRNEFIFYQTQLRKVNNVYSQKNIQLIRLKNPIERLFKKIQKMENDFNSAISISEVKKADQIVKLYSTSILKLTKIVSEGAAIETYLYKTISQTSKLINDQYLKLKQELKSPLDHVEYVNTMKMINKSFLKAKGYYQELKIDKCKSYIIKVIRGFKSLENIFNFEIKARQDFYDNYNFTIIEITNALKYFVEIKGQYKSLKNSGQKLNEDLINLFQALNHNIKELDLDAMTFKGLKNNIEIPFSVKKARMEIILGQVNWSIKLINEFVEKLWTINLDASLMRNKFNRSEAALNELKVNLRKNFIKLNEDEETKLHELSIASSKIAINLHEDKFVIKDINDFSVKTTDFYNLISGKFETAIHVKNMLQELAPIRANNDKLNFVLKVTEKNFLEGKYAVALNGIIEVISEGAK